MKIAIHHKQGSFSERWITYCQQNKINYKVVNAFDNDIINQLSDCDAFMWHHHHSQFKDVLTAKRILFALEHAGVKVFPDFKTGWHFDDKVAQKYLLEAIDAPTIPSYVFYDKESATNWARTTTYPKVFKLKGGAGASNVKLVGNERQAIKLIKRSFGVGFPQFNKFTHLSDCIQKYKTGHVKLPSVIKACARLFITTNFSKMQAPEKGYVYFQKFIPDNKTDFRIKIIGNKCWGFQRKVRKNDFRASGSGEFIFKKEELPLDMLKLAFDTAKSLKLKSVAFDFVLNESRKPLIVEVSYGFGIDDFELQHGYWDEDLNWHERSVTPQDWIISDLIQDEVRK